MVTRVRLGEWLIAHHVITDAQLTIAIAHQKKTGEKLGQALISLGFITKEQFIEYFAKQLNISFYDLRQYKPDPAIASIIPESYARLYRAIILGKENQGYLVGMCDPLDVIAINKLTDLIKAPITLGLVEEHALNRVLNLAYRHTQTISGYAKELSKEIHPETKDTEPVTKVDAPVKKLLDSLFCDAAQMNASDIHIEPAARHIRIRLRIDGMLHEQILENPTIMPAIVSRLKLSCGLDIAEKRFPQDGRFEITTNNKKFDIRLSTMPTPFGESIVMRLLKQSDSMKTLEETGMSGRILERYRDICKKPNGIVLVTGPTGCGKSSTLYATLQEINRPEIKIITIEDPIEYFLPWAIQIQTNDQIELTFASILRSILRHDPDVILLGEMRDQETSSIAMRTALTGRLVLSTLHTNDAISTIYRLINLGIESYIIAATTQAILAQRLVRLICRECIEERPLNQHESAWLSKLPYKIEGVSFKYGMGCSYCNNTGYRGRTAIFELLEFNDEMAEALRSNNTASFHELAKKSEHHQLLADDAFRLVVEGKTSISEMIRVINEGYA